MNNRRVVITGLGVVSSVGIGRDAFWKNIIAGKSGISNVTTFDTSKYDNHKGGEVKDFNPLNFITRKNIKEMGRASQFVVAASKMALEDARLSISKIEKGKIGVVIGTTMADIQSLEQIDRHWTSNGEEDVWATNIVKYPGNSLSDHVGYYLKIDGPNYVLTTACAAGNYSIGYSYDLIRTGKITAMLAGGADPFSRITFTGFSRLFAMSNDVCRPFDRNRKGMMIGEGAGVLLIEELEHALSRMAPIYAEILGYGLSCDAYHMTTPTVTGVTSAIRRALRNAKVSNDEVDYICAHGTGTPTNDKIECSAIREVFAGNVTKIPISSIKSMLGHTMGAASAIEAIATALTIKHNIIPPTINHDENDPDCFAINCVPNFMIKKNVKVALNNSLAFGGNNACVVLKKYE